MPGSDGGEDAGFNTQEPTRGNLGLECSRSEHTSRFLGTKSRWALSNLVKFAKIQQQSDIGAIRVVLDGGFCRQLVTPPTSWPFHVKRQPHFKHEAHTLLSQKMPQVSLAGHSEEEEEEEEERYQQSLLSVTPNCSKCCLKKSSRIIRLSKCGSTKAFCLFCILALF